MEVINLRNYEILNENPRIIYAEGDYIKDLTSSYQVINF